MNREARLRIAVKRQFISSEMFVGLFVCVAVYLFSGGGEQLTMFTTPAEADQNAIGAATGALGIESVRTRRGAVENLFASPAAQAT